MCLGSWICASIFSAELIDLPHEQREQLDVFRQRDDVIRANLAAIRCSFLAQEPASGMEKLALCHPLDLVDELHPLRSLTAKLLVLLGRLDLLVMLLRPGDRACIQFRPLVDLPGIASPANTMPFMFAFFRMTDNAIGRML